jgi:drug/metabolite transporter (DMT)-like permease
MNRKDKLLILYNMNNLWILLSLLIMILTSSKVICMGLISRLNYNKDIMLCIVYILMGFFSIIYGTYLFNTLPYKEFNKIKKINIKEISIFIIFALLKLITTGLVIYTFAISPNIAYSHSIINLNILITILASIIIFNQKLNFKTLFGMILSLVGIIIMLNYSNK